MYKHYILGGFGIRFFADVYVLLTKLKDELDKAYIDSKLEKMGLVDFEFDVRSICFALFDDKEITNSQVLFLNESLSFGIYGLSLIHIFIIHIPQIVSFTDGRNLYPCLLYTSRCV